MLRIAPASAVRAAALIRSIASQSKTLDPQKQADRPETTRLASVFDTSVRRHFYGACFRTRCHRYCRRKR